MATKVEIESKIDSVHSTLLRPNDAFGHVPCSTYSTPMVILLGNHSAGKSTFINRLLGVEEQETGVAPTDDGFTVLVRGDVDLDTDGPSAVSSPQHQFQELSQYGPAFVNHFRVKTRKLPESSLLPRGMMIVDTPGMIDTPVHVKDRTTMEGQNRGYDFLAVTRWFAQRSDVILLMFDPANPGTTGETLDVLTKSLTGFEHKFLILMNKVDMFDKVTDFARAYGTLCWNLSKVIRMKDIPRIYTTFTPLPGKTMPSDNATAAVSSSLPSVAVPLHEMDRARREVLEEVLKAPLRRLDNLITEMDESCKRVLLAGQVSTKLQRRLQTRKTAVYSGMGAACFMLPIGIGMSLFSFNPGLMIVSTAVSGLLTAGALVFAKKHLVEYEKQLIAAADLILEELYPGKYLTAEIRQRWELSVRPALMEFISSGPADNAGSQASYAKGWSFASPKRAGSVGRSITIGISCLPTMSQRTMRKLESVSERDVPALRMEVAAYKETVVKSARTRQ